MEIDKLLMCAKHLKSPILYVKEVPNMVERRKSMAIMKHVTGGKTRMVRTKRKRTYGLKSRCIMTLCALIACRVIGDIPTPGLRSGAFREALGQGVAFRLLDAATGTRLSEMALGALGIAPYITASIFIQLMEVIKPKIKDMRQGRMDERKKIEAATVVLGGIFALLEGLFLAVGFKMQGLLGGQAWYFIVVPVMCWTAYSVLASLAGKYMNDRQDRFVGNGVSLILLVNVLSSYPSDAGMVAGTFLHGKKMPVQTFVLAVLFILIFALFALAVFIQESEKDICVNYSAKACKGAARQSNTIPLKLCPGGVVPVIFASSFLTFPAAVAEMLGKGNSAAVRMMIPGEWFHPQHLYYSAGAIFYVGLIFLFSYFYSDITASPDEISRNLQKAGGCVPGIRPGKPTADYIRKHMRRMAAAGASLLTVIAAVPLIISGLWGIPQTAFLGTSVIIIAGVILETRKVLGIQVQEICYSRKVKKGGLFHERY